MAVCREDAGGAGGDARRAGDALCGPHLRQRGAIAVQLRCYCSRIAALLRLYCGSIAAARRAGDARCGPHLRQ